MMQPLHMNSPAPSRWTRERIAAVGFVGLLHVIAIYALVTGLAQKIVRTIQPDLIVTFAPPPEKPREKIQQLKPSELPVLPQDAQVTPPDVVIETPVAPPLSMPVAPTQPVTADSAVSGLTGTHTTPPYPPLARKLGEEGTVRLRLSISAAGTVVAAEIVKSSGYPDLDETARDWVMAHWRYKPAVQNGVAVPGTALAAVVFNLRNGR